MVTIASAPQDGSLDDVLEALELALEAIDGLRNQIDDVAAAADAASVELPPDERPDRLLAEVGRLHRRVEEIAEASWRTTDDDRMQRALDAIDRLRTQVDEADTSESVLRTLDLVSQVAARLDADDGRALAELTLETIDDLRRQVDDRGDDTRRVLDRSVGRLDDLRLEIEARDPAEALELALEAMDDVGRRVDGRADAIDRRLDSMATSLTGLTELAAALAGTVAELAAAPPPAIEVPPVDDAVIAAIAERVAGALLGRVEHAIGVSTDRALGRVDESTDRMLGRFEAAALPAGDQGTAVVASAAAAMSRLEGRLDSEFGSVERSVDRLDRHLAELEGLVRGTVEAPHAPEVDPDDAVEIEADAPSTAAPSGRPTTAEVAARLKASANGLLAGLRGRGRAVRR